jgi:hypothetical protein
VKFSKDADRTTYLATLLVPFKHRAKKYQTEVINEKVYRIADDDGSWLIIFGDGPETRFGDFEFDGDVLCARHDRGDSLVDCFGARVSLIRHKGRLVLNSVQRVKVDVDRVAL